MPISLQGVPEEFDEPLFILFRMDKYAANVPDIIWNPGRQVCPGLLSKSG
jgi:hypothetical protein